MLFDFIKRFWVVNPEAPFFPWGGGSSGGYTIANSLRFRASNSAYLSRTFGAGNRRTWTFSAWVKRGALNANGVIFCSAATASRIWIGYASGGDQLYFQHSNGTNVTTTAVFRDPSAWLHFVAVWDTTQAQTAHSVSDSRMRVFINGVQQITSGSLPAQNTDGEINNSSATYLGSLYATGGYYYDGLLSEVNFIDGQALTPSSFGQQDINGVWVPKKYTGTYGTNGFHLDFADAATTSGSNAGLGKDVSGNGNYWNTNGISVTAGVTYDALTDTPTNNYATLNPLDASSNITFSEANLKAVSASGADEWQHRGGFAFLFPVYVEGELIGSGSSLAGVGIFDVTQLMGSWNGNAGIPLGSTSTSYSCVFASGNKVNNGSSVAYGSAFATGDKWMMAYDPVSGSIWWGKNGTWFASGDPASGTNPAYTGITGIKTFGLRLYSSGNGSYVNFGQRPFTYTPPTGFKALCTANLPAVSIPNPKKHFDVDTWTGTGSALSRTNWLFKAGLLWGKIRSGADYHVLVNDVVGANVFLKSNTTDAETTNAQTVVSLDANGFSLGTSTDLNRNTYTFVGWGWKAGGTPTTDNVAGAGNTPTAGSVKIDGANLGSALAGTIAATRLSANTTAGFSIVTYTGTGANATVGHGLGVAPKMVITKCRDNISGAWNVYHSGLTSATYAIWLNATTAQTSAATYWNSTAPTSTVFSMGTAADTNQSTKNYVAYCFAEIPGYSKFGSYTGNGSADGPFVHCGFRPKYVMVKRTDSANDWQINDAARNLYNPVQESLRPHQSSVEISTRPFDFTANGFKVRSSDVDYNGSGGTMIFAAFAEHPFGGSNCSPSPAR